MRIEKELEFEENTTEIQERPTNIDPSVSLLIRPHFILNWPSSQVRHQRAREPRVAATSFDFV